MARVAAVIGGSVAGLLAARVLAQHFEQVLLFERDDIAQGGPRKGAPQAHHVHVLLAAGGAAFSRLMPGLFESIGEAGGHYLDMSEHNNWFHFGVWKRRFASGLKAHSQSRVLLEQELARRVRALPQVLIRRASVDRVRWPEGGPELEVGDERIPVDLLVDASGRGSRLPDWMAESGYERPRDEEVVVDVTYTSARYVAPAVRDWTGILIYPDPPHSRRAAAVAPLETGEVIVSQFGWCGERATADDSGFLQFAESLPQPEVAEFLRCAERVTEFRQYRYREARLRHFDEVTRMPPATVALGDALCSVDPVFGQGMTVAALSVEVLERCLGESSHDMAAAYWERVPSAYRTAWALSTGEDFRFPEVSGRRPLGTGFSHWYTRHVHRLTATDDDVYRRFARVMHLVAPPSHLFHPSVIGKVLWSALRRPPPPGPRPRSS
jgi:2-polyprenyl-6-methoxyphenol hydroxylase-like FAD-dependent oxidoreductase